MTIQSYTAITGHQIPERPGIYAFFFNPFKLSRLGIYRDQPSNRSSLEKARYLLRTRIQKYETLVRSEKINGRGTHFSPAHRQIRHIDFHAEPIGSSTLAKHFDSIDDSALIEFINTASAGTRFQPPLYVGMTSDQTLKRRYMQHYLDYQSAGQPEKPNDLTGTFGARLADTGIHWDDLDFFCVTTSFTGDNSNALTAAESLLIDLTEPKLNKRN